LSIEEKIIKQKKYEDSSLREGTGGTQKEGGDRNKRLEKDPKDKKRGGEFAEKKDFKTKRDGGEGG